METSDSECFESADEDFYSDNEENTLHTPELNNLTMKDNNISKIADKQTETEKKEVTKEQTVQNKEYVSDSSKDFINKCVTVSTDTKTEKKEGKAKTKLGIKLGTKITKSDLNLTETNVSSVAKLESKSTDETNTRTANRNNDKCEEDRIVADNDWNSGWNNNDLDDFVTNNDYTVKGEIKETNNAVEKEKNMWEDDDWEPISDATAKTENTSVSEKDSQLKSDSWVDWGNWGVSSILSTATMGVTTITNQVSQGLTTVLESGIGVPEPEELARLHKLEKENNILEPEQLGNKEGRTVPNLSFGLGNFVSGVSQITKLVETTGTKVISGGLDTLETIGKKTMEVLQEGDPRLKKKRAFLKIDTDKPVLSHILREAKEKAEQENKLLEEKRFARRANYESLFDDHQGLVHLEALEMLSRQCDIKLQTLLESQSGNELTEMQETMSQVNELCELTEEDEEETFDIAEIKEKLSTAISEMNVPISYDKLVTTWTEAEAWLQNINLNICDEIELHEQAIDTLAQLTAMAVEQFHKIGELLLIKEHRSTADEADSLVQLTMLLTTLISNVATKLSNKLNEKTSTSPDKNKISGLITNIYYEAANSNSYIKNAFQLLIPVLQVGAV